MQVSDIETWNALKAETEPRVAAIVSFTERWASSMEEIMNDGFPMRKAMNIAYRETPHPDHIVGITDSAALILRDCWKHGRKFFKEYARETGQHKLAGKIDRQDKARSQSQRK